MKLHGKISLPKDLPRHDAPASAIDVVRARRETPGCAHVLHFNNAGAALMPEPVLSAVSRHLQLESEIGGYEAADRAEQALGRAYDAAAGLIGADPGEIALVDSATRAWDQAFYGFDFKPGDRILTGESEYASNFLAFLQVARRTGAVIDVVRSDESGQFSVAALEESLDHKVRLIALTHVPTNGGLVNPAAAVGKVARAAGVPYLLDACQSAGQMPLDVEELGCDFLSATGRKFLRGPRGTGFLYARRIWAERMEPPVLDLAAADWSAPDRYDLRPGARRFEQFEGFMAGRAGLAAAIEYARGWGLDNIYARVQALAAALRDGLGVIHGARVHDLGVEQCGIVSFTLDGADPEDVRDALRERNVNVSVSHAAHTRIDMDARRLTAVLRASVHYYNTEEEVARFLEVIEELP